MLAARRIPRCRTCNVTLLNSIFSTCGANVRLPVPARALTMVMNTNKIRQLGPFGIQPRGFHYTPTVRSGDDGILDEVFETVTETVEAVTELFDIKETGEVGAKITESVVDNITIERRMTVKKENEDDTTEEILEGLIEEAVEGNSKVNSASTDAIDTAEQAIPWFLRVETPRPASHPFALRQVLPDLPPSPPKALSPLLNHISTELGINDLSIMDLRTMDPPPAIGPDTIMIIGNARSERHLHTSADKLCRWLRSEWKMSPDADGLLGRGELKIKNRRLKKKGKLVNTQTGAEEGVGWICINAGDQGLVIQLFTQHRRDEIDLEGLWGGYLGPNAITRSPKATPMEEEYNVKKEQDLEAEVEENTEIKYTPHTPLIRLGAGLSTGSEYLATSSVHPHQRRLFHTTRPSRILETLRPTDPQNPRSSYLIDNIPFRGIEVPRSVNQGKPWHLMKQLPSTYTPDTHPAASELILRAHINQLKSQFPGFKASGSRSGPCTLLGSGPEDKDSTPFLQSFYAHLPQIGTSKTHQLQLELLIEAHRISPQSYPAECLISFLESLSTASPPPAQELYYLVLRALSTSPSFRHPTSTVTLPLDESTKSKLTEATNTHLALLDKVISLFTITHPTSDPTIPEFALCRLAALVPPKAHLIQTIAHTVCGPGHAAATHTITKRASRLSMGAYYIDPRVHVVDKALRAAGHAYILRECYETLLTAYAMAGAWRAFWGSWKRMGLMGVRRDEGLYALVVGLVVMGGVQKEAVVAGRVLVENMGRETPAVVVGSGLAKGLLAICDLAESGKLEAGAEAEAEGERQMEEKMKKGEWALLRERCERVFRREASQNSLAFSL